MTQQFTWIPFYEELATRLAAYESQQIELISFLETLRRGGLTITPLTDKDAQGARFLLTEIDPFTFFGTFNRGITEAQRLGILKEIKTKFAINASLPSDFSGLPILNNMRSWFIAYQNEREVTDVPRLWSIFRAALGNKPLTSPNFLSSFDEALKVKCTNINLTIGLFWVRPQTFLNLDRVNRMYLDVKLPTTGLSARFYIDQVARAASTGKSLADISFDAWKARGGAGPHPKLSTPTSDQPPPTDTNYWMVGAYWSETDPQDQTQRFLDEGVWENGYEDKLLNEVRSMKVGDNISIKATATQRNNLPFDARNHTVSRMTIKAIGIVVGNRGDGRVVEVEWDPDFKSKDWYFYTNRTTVWQLQKDSEYAKRLIAFAFLQSDQDYDWFVEKWYGTVLTVPPEIKTDPPEIDIASPYAIADIMNEGVFMNEAELQRARDRLGSKKNLIIQGPPGVGKTWLARKLAYAFMESQDDKRLEMVQFHQSYSYEDFIRGYRPAGETAGAFSLVDGPFLRFCHQAADSPDHPHIFIIDEINRGNLSQIFGELLMLIEADKRGSRNALPLLYPRAGEQRFYVPENVYILGLMNLADRSLAMVDYALRRRFAFVSLKPAFGSHRFREWLLERGMQPALVDLIVARMSALNETIGDDRTLGANYWIGHSFFCPKGDNFGDLTRGWYDDVVETEIIPLLEEYWFDDREKANQAGRQLLLP